MAENEIQQRLTKFFAKDDPNVTIMAAQGHFATPQSHINYYIDVTRIKMRVKEAEEASRSLRNKLLHKITTVDTIVCLDGTEVLGAFLAQELEKGDFRMTNTHETIYVATLTTGETVRRAMECIRYYGGIMQGVVAIFSTKDLVGDEPVISLFTQEDLPGYATFSPESCPYCSKKIPLEAMVNGFGYSKL